MITRIIIALLFGGWLSQSAQAQTAIARTAGQGSISPLGSAQYSIPIWTPPGIRIVHPNLALVYDSNSPASIAGPGWNLAGLSAITRCNSTLAQDAAPAAVTLTTADRFCLDGNRLRLTSSEDLNAYGSVNSTYQTEIANFSLVTASSATAGNGPAFFTVQGKDGLIYEYGNTTDGFGNATGAQVLAPGTTTPYTWALDKVSDRSGNYMTFTYAQNSGSYVLASIQYASISGTSNFPYQILFGYSAQSAIAKYIAGSQTVQTEELSSITIQNVGTTVRKYTLSYTGSPTTLRPTLTSIQECGGANSTFCAAPTNVAYQYGTAGVASPTTATGSGATGAVVHSLDINGDGRKDLVFATASGGNWHWFVQFASGSGYGAPVDTGLITGPTDPVLFDDFLGKGNISFLIPRSGLWTMVSWNGSAFVSTPTGLALDTTRQAGTPNDYATADVNGDGLPDLVAVLSDGNIHTRLNTGNGATLTFGTATVTGIGGGIVGTMRIAGNNQFPSSSIQHVDINGDGRDDIVYEGAVNTNCHIVSGGLQCSQLPQFKVLVANGTGFGIGFSTNLGGNVTSFIPLNLNNDGCTDFTIPGSNLIYIAGCNGGAATTIAAPANVLAALDWDGDGQTDLLANVSGTLEVYRSTATGLAPPATAGIPVPAGAGTFVVTDQNGDGLDDLVLINASASNALFIGLHNGSNIKPDLATSFTDGYGVAFTPTYNSLVEAGYTRGPSATWPQQAYMGPLYVVPSYTTSDGTGGTYSTTYTYSNGITNLEGRGFAGFTNVQSQDNRTGFFTFSTYQTIFPYIGLLSAQNTTQSVSSKLVQTTSYTPNSLTLDGTANNVRAFPYYNSIRAGSYELGGAKDATLITTTVTTNNSPDIYGRFANTVTTVTDNDTDPYSGDSWTSTTANTYTPTPTAWCLALPTQTTVTNSSTAPGGAAITRTVSYTPDYTNCRITEKITEPGSATYKVTEDFGYDSTTGNLLTDTVTGVAMTASPASRTTTFTWNPTAQFPATIQNALGQTISLGFDPRYGTKTSQSDPNSTTANPLATTWTYDGLARVVTEARPDGTSTTWSRNGCATNCVNSNNKLTVTQTVLNVGGSTQTIQNTYLDWFERTLATSKLMLNGAYDRNEVQYDSLGNIHLQGVPCTFICSTPFWTINTYDFLNRITASQRPLSATNSTLQTTSFGYSGLTTTVTDPPTTAAPSGRVTTKITLPSGLLARTQDNSGYNINFTYDAFGSLLSAVDSSAPAIALFQAAPYAYGIKAFQTSSTDADLGKWTRVYDALGELTSYVDAKNQSFSFLYDALSRPTQRTEPDFTTTFITNWNWGNNATSFNIGKLQSVTATGSSGTYSEAYVYDSKTRLSTKTIAIPGDASYTYTQTYNSSGLLDTLQYPVSTSSYQMLLKYTYSNGILQQISDITAGGPGTTYWTANTTNPRGQILQETLGNGVIVNHAFDAVTAQVQSIQAGVGGGAALQNNSYLFDAVGNLTQRQDGNVPVTTENAFPDSLYRLDHTIGDSNTQMSYDGMGRVSTWAANGSATNVNDYATPQSGCTYYLNSQPHAVRRTTPGTKPPISFCYDANGNMTTISVGGNLAGSVTWTGFNQPADIAAGTTSGQLFYNANHQRYKQIASYNGAIETTIYVGGLLEKVANSTGTGYRHYIPAGNNFIVYTRLNTGTNSTYYISKDHLGSSAVISDSSGAPIVKERFGALGQIENTATDQATIANISRHEFTGQELMNNTGILFTNMNGRVYSPSGGMFLSPDPYVSDPGNTQNYNRYSYVNNNPLTYVDPTGYDCTFTTTVTPGSDGIGNETGSDGIQQATVTGSTSITTLSGCGDFSSFAARFGNGGGGGGQQASAPFSKRKGTPCFNLAQAITGAVQVATGLTQVALGTVQALASLAGAPETAGLSLAGLGAGITNEVVGGLSVLDGISLLNTAFSGSEGGSVLGNAGRAVGGDTGAFLGDQVNTGLAVKAIGAGESFLGISGTLAAGLNAALAAASTILPDLRKPCQDVP
ncbi:MAG: FG-GAP-like repeat-containing protein [Pseudomonadota bacterium]|nr:FG-GAP-like repeat-containing protein [Pseudomonadota bacterium]